jgi:hypothetical protein
VDTDILGFEQLPSTSSGNRSFSLPELVEGNVKKAKITFLTKGFFSERLEIIVFHINNFTKPARFPKPGRFDREIIFLNIYRGILVIRSQTG